MVCPSCDRVLGNDEQLIIHSHAHGTSFVVDHVKITYQSGIKIDIIDSGVYHNLGID